MQDENTGWQAFVFAMFLVPVSSGLYFLGFVGWIELTLLIVVALAYAYFGWKLYKECTRESARKLMFYSFFYLPAFLVIVYLGK